MLAVPLPLWFKLHAITDGIPHRSLKMGAQGCRKHHSVGMVESWLTPGTGNTFHAPGPGQEGR